MGRTQGSQHHRFYAQGTQHITYRARALQQETHQKRRAHTNKYIFIFDFYILKLVASEAMVGLPVAGSEKHV